MNSLDDHELLLWALRAGLTRDEVRQAVRRGLDDGDFLWQDAKGRKVQRQDCVNLDMETMQVVEGVGVSLLELLQRPKVLVEGFQACDVVAAQRTCRWRTRRLLAGLAGRFPIESQLPTVQFIPGNRGCLLLS